MTAWSNLAECDISKIERIICTLKESQYWSDGTTIKKDDVIATFKAFGESGENSDMQEVLRDTRIESKTGAIIFLNPDKDPKVLKLLTYPIFRSDMLEQMRTGRYVPEGQVTSGQYKFLEQVKDTEYIHDRITLGNNPHTWLIKPWFDKIHFKFFESIGALETAQDTLWVIIPPIKNENLWLSERFHPYEYSTQEYFSIFFNTDKLPKNLRNIMHWQIGTSLSWQIDQSHKPVWNIFVGYEQILPRGDIGNFVDIMKKNGYMKRDEWIHKIESDPTYLTGNIIYDAPKFFTNKSKSNTLFVENASGGVLLTGNMDNTVTSIIINGYQLKEYQPWNKRFSYRVSIEEWTLKEWKNTYLLEGKIGDTGSVTGEVLTIYYSPDATKLNEYKKMIDEEYIARNNTPALIAEREREKQIQKDATLTLNPLYYYDKDRNPFRIKVAYITGPQSTESYALGVEKILKNLSIMTELVALEPKALQWMITSGKKDYDVLIAGISVWEAISGIGELFSSKEAGKWVNFANITSEKLDTLFVELRSATTTEKITKITKEIIHFMEWESFFMPIASPIHSLYIDRNLKWIRNMSLIPGTMSVYDILEFASIKDTYIFNEQWKSFFGFFSWLGNVLSGNDVYNSVNPS